MRMVHYVVKVFVGEGPRPAERWDCGSRGEAIRIQNARQREWAKDWSGILDTQVRVTVTEE